MDFDNETDLDALIDGIADQNANKKYGTKLNAGAQEVDFGAQLADLRLD
jgi:hypothetical protein